MTSQTLIGALLVLITGLGIPALGVRAVVTKPKSGTCRHGNRRPGIAMMQRHMPRCSQRWRRRECRRLVVEGSRRDREEPYRCLRVVFRDSTLKIDDVQVSFLLEMLQLPTSAGPWRFEDTAWDSGTRQGIRFRSCRNATARGGLRRSKTRAAFPKRVSNGSRGRPMFETAVKEETRFEPVNGRGSDACPQAHRQWVSGSARIIESDAIRGRQIGGRDK